MPPASYRDPAAQTEREVLKVALQHPSVVAALFDALDASAYTIPAFAEVREATVAAGGLASGIQGQAWIDAVLAKAADDRVRHHITALSVEALPTAEDSDEERRRYADAVVARLAELDTTRRIEQVKSRLQRLNPLERQDEYNAQFAELLQLEQYRRGLRERGLGAL